MYYFYYTSCNQEASLPRILAEDTGAPELRHPIALERTPFKFRKPRWLTRKKPASTPCACGKPCAASC